ncbi:MAG: hypothetical protein V1819_01105 [bacterium]
MKSYKPSHLQKKMKVKKKALKRKRFLKSRLFFDISLAVILGLLLIYLLFFSPVFKIKNIQIVSPIEAPQESIKQIVNKEMQKKILLVIQKDSFLLLNTSELTKKIANEFPQISKVNIKKGLTGNLFIEAKPRIAQSIWCFGEATTTSCFLVDQQRIIFAPISLESPRNDLIFISSENPAKPIFSEVCQADLMERIVETNKVFNDFGLSSSTFVEKSNGFLYAKVVEGWEVYFNPKQDLASDILKLRLLLQKEITPEKRKTLEYIDLRFSKAYYK